jgi:hypothetical protein
LKPPGVLVKRNVETGQSSLEKEGEVEFGVEAEAASPAARVFWKLLEVCRKTQSKTARRPDGVARKETAKIDYGYDICEVLPVDLQSHLQTLGLVDIRSRRSTDENCRIDATAVKVNPVHDLLAVQLNLGLDTLVWREAGVAIELER